MDVDTARLLLHEGLDLLDRLPALGLATYDTTQALAVGTRLRGDGYAPELVAAVLAQSQLRARARTKFGADAPRLLYTPDGLEQATRREVADHHATRFAAARIHTVTDLGCGLGADALGLRRAGIGVHAVDADAATALLASHNLDARTLCAGVSAGDDGRTGAGAGPASPAVETGRAAHVEAARAEDVPLTFLGDTDGVWLDPARRTPGRTDASGRTRRTFRLDAMSPSWEFVTEVAARVAATGAKLSPAFPHTAVPAGAEAEWISTGGELVECALWWGPLARTTGRCATVLAGNGDATEVAHLTEADAADAPPAGSRAPRAGQWLYEADLGVLQAGLVGALVRACDGDELADGAGYVAAETRVDVPYARRHRVAHVMPARPKVVKAWLRSEGARGATIKKRGTHIDPAEFRTRVGLGTAHGDDATLLLVDGATGPLALALIRD